MTSPPRATSHRLSPRRYVGPLVVLLLVVVAFRTFARRDGEPSSGAQGGSDGGAATSGDWSTVDSVFAPEERPELVAAGQQTYGQFCVACHGPIPGGSQPLGPVLQAREYLAYASNRRIDSLIVHGVPGTAMAAWGRGRGGMLDDATVRGLVYYIRSLQPTAPSVPTWRNGRRERLP